MRPESQAPSEIHLRRPVIAIVLIGFIAYLLMTLLSGMPVIKPETVKALPAATSSNLNWPKYGQAAVGELEYGILATHGKQVPAPTASTAKVMTALAVLKKKPLQTGQTEAPKITITQADADFYNDYVALGGSVVPVNVGQQLSEYQALQALLLPSANNIAETLAIWAFGSVEAYSRYANDLAREMGLSDTFIDDASGFSPKTVSSAKDLLVLSQAVMKNPIISAIVGEKSASFPIAGTIHNTNYMLGYDGIVGIKTGNTDQAGGCYLLAANHTVKGKKITFIVTVMGAPDMVTAVNDSLRLLSSAKKNFSTHKVASKNQVVASFALPWGGKADAVTEKDIELFGWNGISTTQSNSVSPISSARQKGDLVGTVSFKDPLTGIGSTSNVVLKQPVDKPSLLWQLTHLF